MTFLFQIFAPETASIESCQRIGSEDLNRVCGKRRRQSSSCTYPNLESSDRDAHSPQRESCEADQTRRWAVPQLLRRTSSSPCIFLVRNLPKEGTQQSTLKYVSNLSIKRCQPTKWILRSWSKVTIICSTDFWIRNNHASFRISCEKRSQNNVHKRNCTVTFSLHPLQHIRSRQSSDRGVHSHNRPQSEFWRGDQTQRWIAPQLLPWTSCDLLVLVGDFQMEGSLTLTNCEWNWKLDLIIRTMTTRKANFEKAIKDNSGLSDRSHV